MVSSGIVIAASPAALEFMDDQTIHVVESSIYKAGYPIDAEPILLIELDGLEPANASRRRPTDLRRGWRAGVQGRPRRSRADQILARPKEAPSAPWAGSRPT